MSLIVGALLAVLHAAALVAAGGPLGVWLGRTRALEGIAVDAALGVPVLGLTSLALIATGAPPSLVYLAPLLWLLPAVRRRHQRSARLLLRVLKARRLAASCGALFLLLTFFASSAPIVNADAMQYHLRIITALAAGNVAPLDDCFQSAGPILGHALAAPAATFANPQALQLSYGLLLALALVALQRRLRVGALAPLYALIGLLPALVLSAFFLEPLNAFLVVTGCLLVRARHALALGLIGGSLVSIKLTGGGLAIFVGVLWLFRAGLKPALKRTPLVVTVALAVLAPFVARDVLTLGTPLFPLFDPDADTMYFAKSGVELMWAQSQGAWTGDVHPALYIVFPLALWFFGGLVGGASFGVPIVLWPLTCRRKERVWLLAYVLAGVPWLLSTPQMRLFWPVVCACSVPAVGALLERLRHQRFLALIAILAPVALGLCFALAKARQGLTYHLGVESELTYLDRRADGHAFHRSVAKLLEGESLGRVFVVGAYGQYASYPALAPVFVHPQQVAERDGLDLQTHVCRANITHVVVRDRLERRVPWLAEWLRDGRATSLGDVETIAPTRAVLGRTRPSHAHAYRLERPCAASR